MKAALIALAAIAVAQGQEQLPAQESGWSALTVDELIDRLPVFETAADRLWLLPSDEDVKLPVADELRRRIESGVALSDKQWRRALLETNTIRIRSEWPADHPFAVGIHQPSWLPAAFIKLTPRGRPVPDARGGAAMRGCFGPNRGENYEELSVLPPDVTEVVFDVLVETREGAISVEPSARWEGELTVPVRMRPGLDDCITPVSDARIDNALRNALRTICLGHQEGSAGHLSILAVDPLPVDRHLFDGLALSMRLEVLNRGEVVARYPLSPECPRADRDDAWLDLGLGGELVPELDRFLHHRWDEAASWSLRLVGTTDNVLRHWNADRYWTGSITVPLLEPRWRELDREEPDRWVGWWIHWFTQYNHPLGRTRN